jgi:4-hydroxythreonine-4-phosphate dehydrogenase
MSKPTIAISIGDPAGVGPEICFKALGDPEIRRLARWVLVGDAWLMDHKSSSASYRPRVVVSDLADDDPNPETGADDVVMLDHPAIDAHDLTVGQVSAACGKAALQYVRMAAGLCLDRRVDAMVTAPINKEAVVLSGNEGFCGHTEFLAEMCGVSDPRLLLFHDKLRVVHVSTHVSLATAIRMCRTERILQTIQIGHQALRNLGWNDPRIAVCGLNPHAGENGLFGSEEAQYISPAIDSAVALGIQCWGPYPADTVLLKALDGQYDLVVAMYHDQGHAPMKLFDFAHTVNVTLGLPIIRTSVDHGTAFDIAGTNCADPEDMKCAMRLAVRMAKQRNAVA